MCNKLSLFNTRLIKIAEQQNFSFYGGYELEETLSNETIEKSRLFFTLGESLRRSSLERRDCVNDFSPICRIPLSCVTFNQQGRLFRNEIKF